MESKGSLTATLNPGSGKSTKMAMEKLIQSKLRWQFNHLSRDLKQLSQNQTYQMAQNRQISIVLSEN